MHSIDPRFKKVFDEMEDGHLQLHRRLNALPERGPELEARLQVELAEAGALSFYHNQVNLLVNASEDYSTQEKEQHRQYVHRGAFSKIIQEAPYYWRIINKPEGYTGDAEMMSIIYHSQFEGETPFGMLMHKHATLCDACQAVRNRRQFLADQIKEKKGKILSVAAGPALEMLDVLTADQSTDTFHLHAFDHDIKTIRKITKTCSDPRLQYLLGNAFHLIKGKYQVAIPRKVMIDFCQPTIDFKGVRRILSAAKYTFKRLKEKDYDLVYTAGLYDYIKTFPNDQTKGAVALTKNLFRLVKPGGSLIIGNFSPNNPKDVRFVMEYICDWHLIYRTKHEMLDFARSIPEQEIRHMEILQEPLGINYFLKIDKTG
jgi:extracellular factor (EF) 3-hydroxypalmitic acid methyl ester biosynthesis protein